MSKRFHKSHNRKLSEIQGLSSKIDMLIKSVATLTLAFGLAACGDEEKRPGHPGGGNSGGPVRLGAAGNFTILAKSGVDTVLLAQTAVTIDASTVTRP